MNDPSGFELVMPFVIVQSEGGPFDDAAFASGWRMGELNHRFKTERCDPTIRLSLRLPILEVELPQADLIAMQHGWVMTDPEPYGEWVHVKFIRQTDGAA